MGADSKWSFRVETSPQPIPFAKSQLAAAARNEGRDGDDSAYFANANGKTVKGKCVTIRTASLEEPLREKILKGKFYLVLVISDAILVDSVYLYHREIIC